MRPIPTAALISALMLAAGASAQSVAPASATPPSATTPPAAAPAAPVERLKISGHVEAGITFNAGGPDDKRNFGRLFDDRANEPLLNQAVLTAERTLDSAAKGFDWGFKLQGLVGSDARYTHSTGLFDKSSGIIQGDIVEAYLNTHFAAGATAGGIDVKLGKFATLEGVEVIDSTGNAFYSHSYIFNFGIPLTHVGALATIHATKDIDLMAGVTEGVNTFKDNNDRVSFHGGFALPNLADGKLSFAFSTHVGPETPHDNKDYRYLNDAVIIYKISDSLTATTDINYSKDDLANASCYGVAQYFTKAIDKTLSASIRGEVWRDNNGFFAAQFGNNTDFLALERGDPVVLNSRTVGGGITTYGELTVGVTWKPIDSVTVRPEVRYDKALNDTTPFNDSRHGDLFTAGVDVTWSF